MAKEQQKYQIETLGVHGGQSPDQTTGARSLPIYSSNAFQFNDTNHAADLFALKEEGYIYSRIHNPTVTALEEKVALLEGGIGALAVASGMAAITMSILNIAHAGRKRRHRAKGRALYRAVHRRAGSRGAAAR